MSDNKVSEKAIWEGTITPDDDTPSLGSQMQTQPQMMFCYKCNNVIPGDSKYCPRCQIKLYVTCPKCGVDTVLPDSIEEVKAIAKLGPNILVAEPTELIGTGKPADKEYVDAVIKAIKEINPDILPFPSAGISKGQDCYNIIKAGSSASGCSSAIAKAENPLALAEEMIASVRKAWDELHG